jgi:RHS repeat-associated protein
VNRRGQTITAAYDLLDRDSVVSAGGASTNYRYSPTDLWLAAWNAESTDTLKLDLAGRVEYEVTKRDSSYTLRSTYNKRGERTKIEMTAPSAWARSVSYGYLAHGGLGTLTAWGANTTLGFNDDRQATSFELPTTSGAKLTVNKAYSSSHMAGEVTYSNASAVNSAVGVRYAQDVMTRITERRNVAMDSVRKFTYDKAGRLIRAQDFRWTDSVPAYCYWDEGMSYQCDWGSPQHYQLLASDTLPWDKVGNPSDGTVQAGNRLTSYRGRTMQYDADGNMTQMSWSVLGVQRVRNLYWNPLGQLDSVKTTFGGVPEPKVSFGYDAFGRRVRKTVGSTTTRYVYDGDHVFTEVQASDHSRLAEYAYYPGVDRPHSLRRWSGGTGTVYFYLTDHPGNVLGLVNASKQLVNEYRYSPFGEHELASESVENRLRYAAREYDSETGLYYNRARYYDAVLRRFVSEDPIGLAGGMNLFAYASDPVSLRDPFGLSAGEWECTVTETAPPPDFPNGIPGVRIDCVWVVRVDSGGNPREEYWANFWSAFDAWYGGSGEIHGEGIGYRTGGILGGAALLAGARAQGARGAGIIIKSSHGARHLKAVGLSAAQVEGAILSQVRSQAARASFTGEFWGRVHVQGVTIEYRAFTLPSGQISIGTYYPIIFSPL